MSTRPFVNLAAYRFVPLNDLRELRQRLRTLCERCQLRGTILLASEGINFFLAGTPANTEQFLQELSEDSRFAELNVKRSESKHQPFHRMLVRIKREIIPCGVNNISPANSATPTISPAELKRWMDEGHPFTLLDVRNDYEIQIGTFDTAMPIGISHFRDFLPAAQRLPSHLKQQPVVMFCTGGIRCEKAGPLLEQEGFENVLQLDGGILKYFEHCGGQHYHGDCFVFDQRVAVDSHLQETATSQCFACQAPLTLSEQQSPHYDPGKSCPHCYIPPEQQQRELLRQRMAAIRRVTNPLPGSQPYENRLPVTVPARYDQWTLVDFLDNLHPHVGRDQWLDLCATKHLVKDNQPVSHDQTVVTGERYERILPETVEPDINPNIEILLEDEAIIVVNKPAPLPMHPSGRFHRNTLLYILRSVYHPICPRNAHRLDSNTSGIVVFSKTRRIAAQLQPQFERCEVTKEYIARVQGRPPWNSFDCCAPISAAPQQAGSRCVDPDGLAAQTRFQVARFCATSEETLLYVKPLTGRTHQIRIHLWHLGFPISGDPLYRADGTCEARRTLSLPDQPMCLHAAKVSFRHPLSEKMVTFSAPLPAWWNLATAEASDP